MAVWLTGMQAQKSGALLIQSFLAETRLNVTRDEHASFVPGGLDLTFW